MAANILISEATEADLPDMVAVTCDAMESDILIRFLYDHRRAEAVRKQTNALTASLGNRFSLPTDRCHIIKALDAQTSELVAWSLLRWEEGQPVTAPDKASDITDQSDFRPYYQQEVQKNWSRLTPVKPHVGKILAPALQFLQLNDQCCSARSPVCKI